MMLIFVMLCMVLGHLSVAATVEVSPVESEIQVESMYGTYIEPDIESHPESESDSEHETAPGDESETNTVSGMESESETEQKSETGTETLPESTLETVTETESETESESESEAVNGTGIESGAGTTVESDQAGESVTDTEQAGAVNGGCDGGSWWPLALVMVTGTVVAGVCMRQTNEGARGRSDCGVVYGQNTLFDKRKAHDIPFVTVPTVSADTADMLMTDKLADALLEHADEGRGSGKTGVVNLGRISAAYTSGEVVTLASLQAKGLVSREAERLKVLASGTLDKSLTVRADAFSMQAVKMILLVGGRVIRLEGHE